jgi:hypothetical protein
MDIVDKIRSDDARSVEMQYYQKWRPRNVKLGEAVRDVISDLIGEMIVPTPNWQGQHFQFTKDNIKKLLVGAGLGKSKGATSVKLVKPVKAQAAVGLTYDVTKQHLFQGHKGDCWSRVICAAVRTRVKAVDDHRLSWKALQEVKNVILSEYALCYIPLLRIDSKPLDPRIIFGGNSIMLALEQSELGGLFKDLKTSPYFAYHPSVTQRRIADMCVNGVEEFLQGDLSHWDRSICSYFMLTMWEAVQELYELDERVMVLCAIYNAYAPLILGMNGELKVYYKDGVQPSGSGGFVPINHLLNFAFQMLTIMNILWERDNSLSFDEALTAALLIMGQVYGDDFFGPALVGASEWSSRLEEAFGIVMKPEQTLVSRHVVVMTSHLYNLESGLVEPIIMRRGRNAVCPTQDPMIYKNGQLVEDNSMHARIKIALAYRAQSVEIMTLAQQGVPGYLELWNFWKESVCPTSRTMPELSDADLSRLAAAYEVSYDSLSWAKKLLPNSKVETS